MKAAADHRVIDVFVVLILHSCGHKKTVEGLVRGKVRAGHFTEMLLRDAFGSHTQVGQQCQTVSVGAVAQ